MQPPHLFAHRTGKLWRRGRPDLVKGICGPCESCLGLFQGLARLALALSPKPQILLMDEPANGIDVRGLRLFYDRVEEIKHNYDLTVIVVSHDKSFVRQYADHVALLNKTVAAFGTADEVLDSDDYHALLG